MPFPPSTLPVLTFYQRCCPKSGMFYMGVTITGSSTRDLLDVERSSYPRGSERTRHPFRFIAIWPLDDRVPPGGGLEYLLSGCPLLPCDHAITSPVAAHGRERQHRNQCVRLRCCPPRGGLLPHTVHSWFPVRGRKCCSGARE